MIRRAVTEGRGVFSHLSRAAGADLSERLLPDDWKGFVKVIAGFFTDAVETFQIRFSENISEVTADALKAIVLPRLTEARELVNGELQDLVKHINH